MVLSSQNMNLFILPIIIQNAFQSKFGIGLGLGDFVSMILSNALVVSGILILFFLIFGGISIMINAGKNNAEGVEKGKKAITAAVVGFVVVFSAYWIIKIIEEITKLQILKSTL